MRFRSVWCVWSRLRMPIFLAAFTVIALIPAEPIGAESAPVLRGLDGTTISNQDARTVQLRSLLKGFAQQKELPCASLLIAQHGRVVFREAYGWEDARGKKPFTVNSVVLTASVTKPLSASVVMALVDQGKISLDDKVSKYLPAFEKLRVAGSQSPAPSPTLRQLLSHTSGLFGLVGATKTGMRAVRDFRLSLEESVDIIAKEELAALPGTRFNYGGANYQVAARIAELATGKPFDVQMKESLLKPLQMNRTYFKPVAGQDTGRVAMPYAFSPQKGLVPIRAYLPDPKRRLILASGGLYSSLNDLAVFLQMHLNGGRYAEARVLTSAAVAEMHRRQTAGAKVPYGLGWFLKRMQPDGQALSINHPGLFGALIWIEKDRDLIGVFLTSSLWKGRKALHKMLREKVLELFPTGS